MGEPTVPEGRMGEGPAVPLWDVEYPDDEQEADRAAWDASLAEPGDNIPLEAVLAEFGDTDLLAS
ncbi:hypothetical protein [Frankia sp. AiPa1]|uniref:hypothetical protein n=1 Tax=Frankia sp. AiPa1 TaxID=573492 RepID=UPI00202AF4C3|nr:hypothetical protein [Frankia sp. AiPa1]MCL9759540.1 hypothetical protein [Frankia sp. AiPa1]